MKQTISLITSLLLAPLARLAAADQTKPNIILILADDMGYSDIGCYGGEIHTPNIDRLATEGLRFRQFYNNAKCTTTRSSLPSGCYPFRAGKTGSSLWDDQTHGLAQALKAAGYYTKGLVAMLQEARKRMGPDKIILFNPLHGDDGKKRRSGRALFAGR